MRDASISQLVARGEYREAASLLSSLKHPTVPDRILAAWVEFEIGDPAKAQTLAKDLLTRATSPIEQAQCLGIAGLAAGRSGAPDDGAHLLRKALKLASTCDASFEAELLARYIHGVLTWIGIEPAVAELAQLRQLSLKVGSRRALVEYHIAQARIAALRGWPAIALKEIRIAENLLGDKPYRDLLWRIKHFFSGIALMDGDAQSAYSAALASLSIADEDQSTSQLGFSLGTLAYIAFTTGRFEEARSHLERCLRTLPPSSRARLATFNTGINLGLALGDAKLAQQMLSAGIEALGDTGSEPSYYGLWFEEQRIHWLIRTGDCEQAIRLADKALQSVHGLADSELADRLRIRSAEALALIGRLEEANRFIADVCVAERQHAVEITAELLRVSALLCREDQRSEATGCLVAAFRLLSSAGLYGCRRAVERTAADTGINLRRRHKPRLDTLNAARALGTVVMSGRHPWIMGREVVAFLRSTSDLGYVALTKETEEHSTVLESTGRPTDFIGQSADDVAIWLGSDSHAQYWLRASRPATVAHRLLWTSIDQIVKASLALHGRLPGADTATDTWTSDAPTLQYGMVVAAEQSFDLVGTARKLAPSSITVLVTGETGTGKELLARALHDASPRSARPFVPYNCSAVPRDMLDAQLFGYRRGAFTGALDHFDGVIRAAAGGTLLLDEIGEVPLDVQPKLLRFLESGEIHPLGEPRPVHVDVRVVAATNADLDALVAEGRFRQDLFYRLNVVHLHVPPLRQRREEIPPLVNFYIDKCSRETQKTGIRVDDETMEYLILYRWPGNVRQLVNEMRRMVALAESGAVLMPEHLSHDIVASRRTIPASARPLTPTEVIVRMDQPMSAAMEHVERSMIQYTLARTGGRVELAAARLGLSRKGLYLKRQRLGLAEPAVEASAAPQ